MMLTEPVTCSYCGAVSVNGGKLACAGCHERALAEIRRLREEVEEHRKASQKPTHISDLMIAHLNLRRIIEEPPCQNPPQP